MVATPKKWLNTRIKRHLRTLKVAFQDLDPYQMPVTVDYERMFNSSEVFDSDGYLGYTAASFLANYEDSAVLLGEPGSGKSYAVRVQVLNSAWWLLGNESRLHEHEKLPYVVPVFVDLKSYQGDLKRRFDAFEKSIGLKELVENQRVEFLIDSFNEVRNEYRANGQLVEQMQECMERTPGCRWTVTSRSENGLEFFRAPRFRLSLLKKEFVSNLAKVQQLNIGPRYHLELTRLLRRPFFLSAFLNGRLEIPQGGMHPADAIEQILKSFEGELSILLRIKARLPDTFGQLALKSIENSNEIVPLEDLVSAIQTSHQWPKPIAERAIKKLIELGLFQSIDSQRAAFYHQSVTEMLAAMTISQQFDQQPELIDQVLSAPCWDGVLNLLPYYLSATTADAILQRLRNRHDYSLATKFLRGFGKNQVGIVSRYLDQLLDPNFKIAYGNEHNFYMSLRHLPVGPQHIQQLKALTAFDDRRRHGALRAFFDLVGLHHKDPLGDYPELEFDNAIQWYLDGYERHATWGSREPGDVFERQIPIKYLKQVLDMAQTRTNEPEDDECQSGLTESLGFGCGHIPAREVSALLSTYTNPTSTLLSVVTEWANDKYNDIETIDLLLQLILLGHRRAVFYLYLKIRHDRNALYFLRLLKKCEPSQFACFTEHVKSDLLGKSGQYGVSLLALVCDSSEEFRAIRDRWIQELSTPYALALLATDMQRVEDFWVRMTEFALSPPAPLTAFEYQVLAYFDDENVKSQLKWEEHPQVLNALMRRGDTQLVGIMFREAKLESIRFDWPILETYLSLPLTEISARDYESKYQTEYCFKFIAANISDECRSRMLQEVNDPNSIYRDNILTFFLPRYTGAKLIDFTAETVETMVARLHTFKLTYSRDYVLCSILKTADDVRSALGPYFAVQEEPFRSNLRLILNELGKYFSCRFGS